MSTITGKQPQETDTTTSASMTLEQQIGQLFMVGFHGPAVTPEITELIQQHHVGGVVLFSRNIRSAEQVFALTSELQALARAANHPYPLLISIDQENGMVQRLGDAVTAFPGNMALGAVGDEAVTAEVAEATGRELKALGITMNLAPDADVNNNPANPVVGTRSFGANAQEVARHTAAAVRGYRAASIVSSIKHFPGHGDTATDSHLGVPVLPFTLERLQSLEFVPFVGGIAAGADTVMIAHVALPQLMDGAATPATLSPAIIRGLLREQLGYEGVIISDCLEMEAVSETVGTPQGSVLTLQAGTDIALVSHEYTRQKESLAAVRAAVQSGALPAEAIAQAAARVLRLKQQRLSRETLPTEAGLREIGNAAHQQLRDQVYARSTTLIRQEGSILPLHLDETTRILVLAQLPPSMTLAIDLAYPHESLVESIRRRHTNTHDLLLRGAADAVDNERLREEIEQSNLIIMATINAHTDPAQVTLMQRLLASGKRVIGLAICNPYDLAAFPQLRTYLATYEYTKPALESAVRVLFGEAQPQGKLPVTIPGITPMAL